MATIAERADALYPISNDDYIEPIGYYTYADLKTDECNAYIKGAEEQHNIDVQNVKEHLEAYKGFFNIKESVWNEFITYIVNGMK